MAPSPLTFRFVLVRPANALNIGAVGRAMANFGLDDLAAVSPVDYRWKEARSAIYGSKVLDRAAVKTLPEALEGCVLVLGTASAHNRAPKQTVVTLPALLPWFKKRLKEGGRVAVLFGSERNGLDNEDFSHCHALLRIPTAPDAPSMNLGQAAALVAYELSRLGLENSVGEPKLAPPPESQLDGLVAETLSAMAKVKINAHMSEATRRQKVRQGFLRWNLSDTDAAWLRGLFHRLSKP